MVCGIPSPPRRRRAKAIIPLHIDQCVPTEHHPESFNLTLEKYKQHLSTKETEKSQFFKLRHKFFWIGSTLVVWGPPVGNGARHRCCCRCLQTHFLSNTQKEREWACTLVQGRWKGGQRNSKKTRARQRARQEREINLGKRANERPREESKRASKRASERERRRAIAQLSDFGCRVVEWIFFSVH